MLDQILAELWGRLATVDRGVAHLQVFQKDGWLIVGLVERGRTVDISKDRWLDHTFLGQVTRLDRDILYFAIFESIGAFKNVSDSVGADFDALLGVAACRKHVLFGVGLIFRCATVLTLVTPDLAVGLDNLLELEVHSAVTERLGSPASGGILRSGPHSNPQVLRE